MRIFEVKNNLVKIFYETSDNLFLSGFVMIKDSRESYIGQIMHLESSKHGNVAIAKIIFNITEEGVITTYSGSIPAINSAISNINSVDFLKLIQGQTPILIGEFIDNDILVSLDKSFLENKLVICSENQENSDLMIKTLNQQIKNYSKKTVIIDTDGESIFDKNTFIMGENFRLPINNQLINFIYENGLDFKSARSKAILQETFLEIQYYLSSLEEPYIPVKKFIDILEKQYENSKLPELVLLKNALVRFDEAGIFARNLLEYKNVFESLLQNQTTIINIANVDESIQRETISYIYNVLSGFSEDFYVFVKLNNTNSDKKLLKQIFSNSNIYSITNCSYSYKYLTELKKISKDLILFTPLLQQQDFASYNTFLTTLGRTEFVVYGKATQYMPLIIKLSEKARITRTAPHVSMSQEDAQRMVQNQLKEQQRRYEAEKVQQEAYNQQQQMTQQMFQQQMAQMVYPQMYPQQPQIFYPQQPPIFPQPQMFAQPMYNQPYMQPYPQMQQPYMAQPFMQNPQQPFATQPIQPAQSQTSQTPHPQQNVPQQQAPSEVAPQIFKSIEPQEMPVENPSQDVHSTQNSNIINVDDPSTQLTEEDLDQIQDVDIYEDSSTQEKTPEIIEENPFEPLEHEIQTEEDDSYLDEIQPDENDIIEEEVSDPETEEPQDMKTKYNITEEDLKEKEVVPIYPANTGSNNINVEYNKGDVVVHKEFGTGRVEKIINYGSKKLCSVYFEGLGRRLLDPTLSELKKAN